jgi:hypothetical protein
VRESPRATGRTLIRMLTGSPAKVILLRCGTTARPQCTSRPATFRTCTSPNFGSAGRILSGEPRRFPHLGDWLECHCGTAENYGSMSF